VFQSAYLCHFWRLILVFILIVSACRIVFATVHLCTIASRLYLPIRLLLVVALLLFLSS
jgi:hypothetical protein